MGQISPITVVGDVTLYVTGKATIPNGGSITVSPGSSLKLYLGGDLDGKNGSGIINQSPTVADPNAANVRIYGLPTCQKMVIKNSADFVGAIYAPKADIQINNGGNIIGSIIGNSLTVMNSGSFYYDMNLAQIEDPSAMYIKVVKWWED